MKRTSKDGLKARERRVLRAIAKLADSSPIPPTLGEIANVAEMDVSNVCRSVAVLEREGYVSRKPGAYRSLQLVRRPSNKRKAA